MRPLFSTRIVQAVASVLLGLVLLSTLLVGAGTPAQAAQGGVGFLGGMRGVAFVQDPTAPFGSDASYQSLQRLKNTGANYVSIVATFHQQTARSSTFYRNAMDPTDQGLAQVINYAHSLNLKVMLQPVVLSEFDGIWAGSLSPSNYGDWFKNYTDMMKGYGRLAQQTTVDLLCIGTEFYTLTKPEFSNSWRGVIAGIQTTFFGPLTYSANWGDKKTPEYATIDWWNLLDYIGISAYFPLSWNNFLTEPLRAGWFSYRDPFGPGAQGEEFHWVDQINSVRARWNKPVIFTKIGFGSYANSPGRWDVHPDPARETDVQANAYDGTMAAWSTQDWMKGIFWSPWYSNPNAGGMLDAGESPQNKPAAAVLTQWYSK